MLEARDRVGDRVWSQELVPGDPRTVIELQVTGHRDRPDQLRSVDEHDRPGRAGRAADRGDVGPVAGRGLNAAERDQPGAAVDPPGDVVRLEPAVAEGDPVARRPAVW